MAANFGGLHKDGVHMRSTFVNQKFADRPFKIVDLKAERRTGESIFLCGLSVVRPAQKITPPLPHFK